MALWAPIEPSSRQPRVMAPQAMPQSRRSRCCPRAALTGWRLTIGLLGSRMQFQARSGAAHQRPKVPTSTHDCTTLTEAAHFLIMQLLAVLPCAKP
eukprot:8718203-Alexandrium_andersonii.AAC.1